MQSPTVTLAPRRRRQRRYQVVCGGLLTVLLHGVALADPVAPRDQDQVLERLPRRSPRHEGSSASEPRWTQPNAPANVFVAVARAKDYIEQSRAESDPRYLGYAQAALQPWWAMPVPPVEVLVLRATLRQSNHDFEKALEDLDLVLRTDPANAQAWLTRAIILQVRGEFTAAKRACIPLWRRAPELVYVTATTSIASLNGEALPSYNLLIRTVAKHPDSPASERLWALTAMAEMAARLAQAEAAEAHFKQALSLGQRDGYLLGALADFLLDQDRPGEVMALLKNETRSDALLLRLALAEQRQPEHSPSPPSEFGAHVAMLKARFEASRRRGDTGHQREAARFHLHLLNQPRAALALAQANWAVQREPSDARIFMESALAAPDRPAAQPVLDWRRTNRLEDAALAKLARRF